MKRGLVVILAIFIGLWIGSCAQRQVETEPVSQTFQTHYPERQTYAARTFDASKSLERVIYGRITDPVSAARKTAKFLPLIDLTAQKYNVPKDCLAGLVFLESSGNRLAVSSGGAAGLTQLMPKTAADYQLRVNLNQSFRLIRKRRLLLRNLDKAKTNRIKTGSFIKRQVAELIEIERKLPLVDERFDPGQAIETGGNHLHRLYQKFGQWDLALAAYHAGEGNLGRLVKLYTSGWLDWQGTTREMVTRHELTYARMFFDITPADHPKSYRFLMNLGDSSRDYYFRVQAAADAMYLWRKNRPEFHRLVRVYKSQLVPRRNELVIEADWYPPDPKTNVLGWSTWADLETAYGLGDLVRLPPDPGRFGLAIDEDIGAMAAPRARQFYRGLTPPAAGLLCYIANEVRRQSKTNAVTLRITSLVRSVALQQKFVAKGLSPAAYSTHCEGVAFDIAPPKSPKALAALQYVLDDLRYRYDICYARERRGKPGDHFHVTLAPHSAEKFYTVWNQAERYWQLVQANHRPKNRH